MNVGSYCVVVIWAVALYLFFQFWYPYHFFFQEQNQIFLCSWDYISSYFEKPGGLARLTGDFLTQFGHLNPVLRRVCRAVRHLAVVGNEPVQGDAIQRRELPQKGHVRFRGVAFQPTQLGLRDVQARREVALALASANIAQAFPQGLHG